VVGVFVNSLSRLNEEVNEHAAMTRRDRKFLPRLGMLVLARQPSDGLYEIFVISVDNLHY